MRLRGANLPLAAFTILLAAVLANTACHSSSSAASSSSSSPSASSSPSTPSSTPAPADAASSNPATSSPSPSTGQSDATREAQTRFVQNYIAAIRSGDMQQIKQTLHPQFRSCINAENQPFFDFMLSKPDQPKTGYKIASIKPAPERPFATGILPADGFPYPVKPTNVIQIDFDQQKDSNSLYSTILEVAPDHSSSQEEWYWVGPCPNAKGMEFVRQKRQERAKQEADAAKRVAELKDPLLSEITGLLKEGRKIDAIKKYSAATGADMTTAVQVINQLEQGAAKPPAN